MGFSLSGVLGAMRDLLTGSGPGSETRSADGLLNPTGNASDRAHEEALRQADDQRRVLNQLVGRRVTTQKVDQNVRQDPHALVGSQVSTRNPTSSRVATDAGNAGAAGPATGRPTLAPQTTP